MHCTIITMCKKYREQRRIHLSWPY